MSQCAVVAFHAVVIMGDAPRHDVSHKREKMHSTTLRKNYIELISASHHTTATVRALVRSHCAVVTLRSLRSFLPFGQTEGAPRRRRDVQTG